MKCSGINDLMEEIREKKSLYLNVDCNKVIKDGSVVLEGTIK